MPQAEGEIDGCTELILSKCADIVPPEDVYSETEDRKIVTVRRPIGVVACICPWNYPLFTCVQKWAPALMLGNTVTPFTYPILALHVTLNLSSEHGETKSQADITVH